MPLPRKKPILIGATIFLAALTAFFFWPSPEPTYNGRKLSEWVIRYSRIYYIHPEENKEPPIAIAHIGTNAIPFLLEWIQYRHPAWMDKVTDEVNPLLKKLGVAGGGNISIGTEKDERAIGAAMAFKILGPRAECAVPKLVRLLNDTNQTYYARANAAYSLGGIGPKAFAPLMQTLTNSPGALLGPVIGSFRNLGTNALPAIPVLTNYLQHTNPIILVEVTRTLGNLRLEPERIVPLLTASLTNQPFAQFFAENLGKFGPEARSAIPALQALLTNQNNLVPTNRIVDALHEIDPNAFPNASAPLAK